MVELLLEIKKDIETLKAQDVDFMAPDDIRNYMQRYDEIIANGKEENALKSEGLVSKKTGKPKKGEPFIPQGSC